MKQMIVSLGSFFLVGILFMMHWSGHLVMKPMWIVSLGAITIVGYMLLRIIEQESNPKLNQLMNVTMSVYVVLFIASLIHYKWIFDRFISASFLSKAVMLLLLLIALYLNFIFIRMESSYKKKRGNQRIKEKSKGTFIEQLKALFKKEQGNPNDIFIFLGEETNDESKKR